VSPHRNRLIRGVRPFGRECSPVPLGIPIEPDTGEGTHGKDNNRESATSDPRASTCTKSAPEPPWLWKSASAFCLHLRMVVGFRGHLFSLAMSETFTSHGVRHKKTATLARSRFLFLPPQYCLLNVAHFACLKRNLHVFVNINQFRIQVDNLRGSPERGGHLVNRLPQFNLRGRRSRRRNRRRSI